MSFRKALFDLVRDVNGAQRALFDDFIRLDRVADPGTAGRRATRGRPAVFPSRTYTCSEDR